MNKLERKKAIGESLRELRKKNEKTLLQVADAVHLKENTISAYERGVISIPLDNLDDICKYLGTDYLTLLSEIENK